jgi:hypothetical protein
MAQSNWRRKPAMLDPNRAILAETEPSDVRLEIQASVPLTDERTRLSPQTWIWAGALTAAVVGILSSFNCMLLLLIWVAYVLSPELGFLSIVVWLLSVLPVSGLVQWLFLRQRVPALRTKPGLWMLMTPLPGTLVLLFLVPVPLVFSVIFLATPPEYELTLGSVVVICAVVLGMAAACGGILTAVLQALFLRKAVSRAGWWIPPTVLGWILGAVGGALLCIPVFSTLLT